HHAGFRIYRDVSHYRAANAAGDQIARSGILAQSLNWLSTEPGASIFPTHAARRRRLYADASANGFEFLRLGVEGGSNFGEELLAGVNGCATCGRTHAANRGAAAGTAGFRILIIADLQFY